MGILTNCSTERQSARNTKEHTEDDAVGRGLQAYRAYLAGIPVLCFGLGLHQFICLFHSADLRLREAWDNIMKLETKQLQPATDVCSYTERENCTGGGKLECNVCTAKQTKRHKAREVTPQTGNHNIYEHNVWQR